MESIHTRVITIINKVGIDDLVRRTEIGSTRWQTVKYKKARVTGDDIEALVAILPQYAYWLTTGKVAPEIGQVSPEYEEASQNSDSPKAG
jgi:hypothetical protein